MKYHSKPIFDKDGALTKEFLLKRGYCCKNGCKNCPWNYKKKTTSQA